MSEKGGDGTGVNFSTPSLSSTFIAHRGRLERNGRVSV